jgi:hypothetical protein
MDGLHVKIYSGLGQELGVRGKVRNRMRMRIEYGSQFGFGCSDGEDGEERRHVMSGVS